MPTKKKRTVCCLFQTLNNTDVSLSQFWQLFTGALPTGEPYLRC